MKRVDLAKDLGGASLEHTINQDSDDARTVSEVRVYVMEVEIPSEGYGYISVHRTLPGARRKLEQIVDQWGMRQEFDVIIGNAVNDAACFAAGEEGDPIVFGISLLPVEE